MLRKWRRNMKRRIEDEVDNITIKHGAVASIVLGSAVAVLVFTANLDDTIDQKHAVAKPSSITTSDKKSNVSPQLPELKITNEQVNVKKDVAETLELLVAKEPTRDLPQQVRETNSFSVEAKPMIASLEEKVQKEIVVAQESSKNTHDAARLEVVESVPVNAARYEKSGESISRLPAVVSEKETAVKPTIFLGKKDEAPIAKFDTAPKANTTSLNNEKAVESNEKNKTVASKTEVNVDDSKPIVDIDKKSMIRAEIDSGNVPSRKETIITEQPKVEIKAAVSEVAKSNNHENDIHALGLNIAKVTVEKDAKTVSVSEQVSIGDSVDERLLTSDTITLQSVNSSSGSYTIKNTADGTTCMTIVPKNNEPMIASASSLANTDITVFQVKNGNTSYNGTYYIENSKSGLTMAQRSAEEVKQPGSESAKAQGTYMTMKWKDNPGSDFFIGFNGSSLVVYPLDDDAKDIVSDTNSMNNRPIVASSIIEAVGNMQISLAQIQSVSIYAE